MYPYTRQKPYSRTHASEPKPHSKLSRLPWVERNQTSQKKLKGNVQYQKQEILKVGSGN